MYVCVCECVRVCVMKESDGNRGDVVLVKIVAVMLVRVGLDVNVV